MSMARKIAMTKYESTVERAVSDALSTLEELGGECRDVCDNMPESLQSTDRYSTLDATASDLEYLSEPDCPEWIGALAVIFEYKPQRRMSRSDRRSEAVRVLEAARDAAQAWLDDPANDHADADTPEALERNDQREEVEQWLTEVGEIIDTAENVEFPGMFG
jgi:hypothetical protein